MQKVDGVAIDNHLPDGSNLFAIDDDNQAIEVGLIVVDTRLGRIVKHVETGATYTLGFVVAYPHGEAFAAFGLNGVADIIAPATSFMYVGGANEQ